MASAYAPRMRFATLLHADAPTPPGPLTPPMAVGEFGVVDGDHLIDLRGRFASPAEAIALEHRGAVSDTLAGAPRVPLAGRRLLPPVPEPRRILCIGVNYAAHAAESDRPTTSAHATVFTRFASSFVGHDEALVRPHVSERFDYEGELGVYIGRAGRYIGRDDALDHVAGYTCCNDGTLRDYQRHSSQFVPGKTFDRSGSCGPHLVTADEVGDPADLRLTTTVNDVVVQDAPTSDLIHDVPALIAYCSQFTTLEVGDLILTGTPGGVGYVREPPLFLRPGDVVAVSISTVGILRNTVVDEPVT